MSRSYAARLALAFAAVGVAAAAITALVVNVVFAGLLAGYFDQQQQARQRQIVSLLAESYSSNAGWDAQALGRLAPGLMMQRAEVRVEDGAGSVVWDSGSSGAPNMMGGGYGMRGGMMGTSTLGAPQRFPITVAGQVVGTAVIRLPAAGSQAGDVSFRDAVNRSLLLAGIGAALLAALLGVALARRATVPVRELTAAAGRLAAGDREQRLEQRSQDEFGAMAAAFNSMAESIAEEDRLRRTFAADVAHELRTPLMILSAQLEALDDGMIALTEDAVHSLEEETQRITRLVADLEVLASADAVHFTLERRRLEVSAELRAVAADFAPLFAEKSVALETSLQPAWIEGDAGRLRQVASNLLSNALKFTPAAGRVELAVRQATDTVVLRVTDSGPGIAPDELPHVFDRFFRGRTARAGGSGIGLTVVRELVTAHGGTVTVANAASGGAIFTVTLPAAQQPALRPSHSPRAAPATL